MSQPHSAPLTSDEKTWLTKNGGGESRSLRQHGLSIYSEDDRDEGRIIMGGFIDADVERHLASTVLGEEDVDRFGALKLRDDKDKKRVGELEAPVSCHSPPTGRDAPPHTGIEELEEKAATAGDDDFDDSQTVCLPSLTVADEEYEDSLSGRQTVGDARKVVHNSDEVSDSFLAEETPAQDQGQDQAASTLEEVPVLSYEEAQVELGMDEQTGFEEAVASCGGGGSDADCETLGGIEVVAEDGKHGDENLAGIGIGGGSVDSEGLAADGSLAHDGNDADDEDEPADVDLGYDEQEPPVADIGEKQKPEGVDLDEEEELEDIDSSDEEEQEDVYIGDDWDGAYYDDDDDSFDSDDDEYY